MTGTRSARSAGMHRLHQLWRSGMNHFVTVLAVVSTVLVLVPLVAILGYLDDPGLPPARPAFEEHLDLCQRHDDLSQRRYLGRPVHHHAHRPSR